MNDAQLTLVDSWEEAEAFLRWLGQTRAVLAVDTETTGLKWWTPSFLRLVQFGDAESGWAIPVDEWKGVIRRALSLYRGDIAMHNAQFDLHALDSAGIPLPSRYQLQDTKILHALADPLLPHSLKRIGSQKYGDAAVIGERILRQAMAQNKWTWATVPVDYPGYWVYACWDAVLTARIWEDMPHDHPAYEREMDVARLMFAAEKRGLLIDTEYTQRLAGDWMIEMEEIQACLDRWGL